MEESHSRSSSRPGVPPRTSRIACGAWLAVVATEGVTSLWVVGLIVAVVGVLALFVVVLDRHEMLESAYENFDEAGDDSCLVCDAAVPDRLDDVCPACGFDPIDPADDAIEEALEELAVTELLATKLTDVVSRGRPEAQVREFKGALDSLAELEAVETDALPWDAVDARLEGRMLVESERLKGPLETCSREIGAAQKRLVERIRELAADPSSDAEETSRSLDETHAW